MEIFGTLPLIWPIIMDICSNGQPFRDRIVANVLRPVCVDTNRYFGPVSDLPLRYTETSPVIPTLWQIFRIGPQKASSRTFFSSGGQLPSDSF